MTNNPHTPRPFSDLRSTGLLWLINTTVFHPRGYALGLNINDEGEVIGWCLLGDGTEPWTYDHDPDKWPPGEGVDDAMRAAKELLK